MRILLSTLLISGLTLTGCGYVRDSAINPANWFGRSQAVAVDTAVQTNPLIPAGGGGGLFRRARAKDAIYTGIVFEKVVDLQVERVPGGALIRATGRAARQGRYEVRLTPVTKDEAPVDGVLTYRFEGVIPPNATDIGTPPTREATAARKVTDQDLRGVRTIRVEGLQNARVVSR